MSEKNKQFEIVNNVLVKYYEQDGITDVIIPDGVTEIGEYAFSCCENLTSIKLPEELTKIKKAAFEYCTSLTSITIPDSVNVIEHYAFSNCTNLTSIKLPEELTQIRHYTFHKCTNLINIIIPENVTKIEYGAFSLCISLTNITIPESVIEIGDYAFENCKNVITFNIPSYEVFTMLNDYLKLVSINTIIRDKKEENYSSEDMNNFKEFIINQKMFLFIDILKNNNLKDLLYYMLHNNIYTNEELIPLIDYSITKIDNIAPEVIALLLEYKNKNVGFENPFDKFNLDDDFNHIIK